MTEDRAEEPFIDDYDLMVIRKIPVAKVPAQYSLQDQLRVLHTIANRMKLYDAADFIRRGIVA